MKPFRALVIFGGWSVATLCFAQTTPLEAVTFADAPNETFVAIRELASATETILDWDPLRGGVVLNDHPIPAKEVRELWDGTKLANLATIRQIGGVVAIVEDKLTLTFAEHDVTIQVPRKWVEVNLNQQYLRAWQGERLIIRTKISSGRRGYETPLGTFQTGPGKEPMHFSTLYENAPMPYAIQVDGNVFAHGSAEVPRRPASHGCVRIPTVGRNAAQFFYNWVDKKVSFVIQADWSDKAKLLIAKEAEPPTDVANVKVYLPSNKPHPPRKKKRASKPQPKPVYGPFLPGQSGHRG